MTDFLFGVIVTILVLGYLLNRSMKSIPGVRHVWEMLTRLIKIVLVILLAGFILGYIVR